MFSLYHNDQWPGYGTILNAFGTWRWSERSQPPLPRRFDILHVVKRKVKLFEFADPNGCSCTVEELVKEEYVEELHIWKALWTFKRCTALKKTFNYKEPIYGTSSRMESQWFSRIYCVILRSDIVRMLLKFGLDRNTSESIFVNRIVIYHMIRMR
jgi:hypothetical protein